MSTVTAPAPSEGAPLRTPTPRRRGPGSGLLLAIGLAFALAAIGSITFTLISLWWLRSDTTTTDLGSATAVQVRQSCGGVTIREEAVDHVVLTSKRWMTIRKPKVATTRSGSTVDVAGDCPGFSVGFSGWVSLTLVVPKGTTIDASSSAGGVHLYSLSGRVTAHSSAGSVTASELRSTTVDASSSAGSVHLSFATAPMNVTASSSAGRVTVEVPDDGTAYAVDASSSAGSTHVDIATDPKSTRHISAKSSAGSVDVEWR